ncbi:MAG: metallophosphoesterase [Coriobacteriia bacterium]|nr:metallophosphoesterase [Coriobacteriia bacterium]
MLLGICSDIHRQLSAQAYEALEGVDRILCAGDLELPSVLIELETIAPVTCVRGNCDGPALSDLPFSQSITLGGIEFFLIHRPEDIGIPPATCQVVVHGHTHIPRNEVIGKVRYLNPGSTRKPRGGSQNSLIKMEVADGEIKNIELVTLD